MLLLFNVQKEILCLQNNIDFITLYLLFVRIVKAINERLVQKKYEIHLRRYRLFSKSSKNICNFDFSKFVYFSFNSAKLIYYKCFCSFASCKTNYYNK